MAGRLGWKSLSLGWLSFGWLGASLFLPSIAGAEPASNARPHILFITVDTLRADHLSGYGYALDTSPHLDRLMEGGGRFSQARTVIPVTCPSFASMFTTFDPHEHGATRNGIPIHPRLPSLPKVLGRHGYRSAALISNWVLKNSLCGLEEHFSEYHEVLERRMMIFGRREADADDVTEDAIEVFERHQKEAKSQALFLWVHYMEPHFPYQLHRDYLKQLGLGAGRSTFSMRHRYDTEIARVDVAIGELLDAVRARLEGDSLMVVFTSDHGESLGHHGYWGHGKHVYDSGLHIPLAITWKGVLPSRIVEAPIMTTDLPATVLGLLGIPRPEVLGGVDFSPVLRGESEGDLERVTFYQAHSNALGGKKAKTRRSNLLEVARLEGSRKDVLVLKKSHHRVFDLLADPLEKSDLAAPKTTPPDDLKAFKEGVLAGLKELESEPIPDLDEESKDKLEALGYVD